MKHYVFGGTVKGFIDYLRSIWRMKADIKNYECSRNEEFKQYRYEDYREAKTRYEQFKYFSKVLFDSEQEAGFTRAQEQVRNCRYVNLAQSKIILFDY